MEGKGGKGKEIMGKGEGRRGQKRDRRREMGRTEGIGGKER